MNNVKQIMNTHTIDLEEQLSGIQQYKTNIEELTQWISKAEIKMDTITAKPISIKDIEDQLKIINVSDLILKIRLNSTMKTKIYYN